MLSRLCVYFMRRFMMEYIKRYGEDETTIIPGTDKHFNYETLKEMLEDKNPN